MVPVELFVSPLCPYVMRTQIALAEKGVDAAQIEIDVRNKPSWFLELSPNGKIPLLRHGQHLIGESAIIVEYLDEAFPTPPLMPLSFAMRAKARELVAFADTNLYAKTAAMLHSIEPAAHAVLGAELVHALRRLMTITIADSGHNGAYLLGADFTVADVAFYPWFEQLCVLEQFRGFRFPSDCEPLLRWRDMVAARDALRPLTRPPTFYLEQYGRLSATLGLERRQIPA